MRRPHLRSSNYQQLLQALQNAHTMPGKRFTILFSHPFCAICNFVFSSCVSNEVAVIMPEVLSINGRLDVISNHFLSVLNFRKNSFINDDTTISGNNRLSLIQFLDLLEARGDLTISDNPNVQDLDFPGSFFFSFTKHIRITPSKHTVYETYFS